MALVVKNLPINAGDIRDADSIPESGRSPGGGHGNPLQHSCLENPHAQRNLVCCSPWGHKESDITEQLYNKGQEISLKFPIQDVTSGRVSLCPGTGLLGFPWWVRGFPGGTISKNHTCQYRRYKRRRFNPWVGKIPWRRAWQPTPVFLPGESHGQRSLESHSPYGQD